MLLNARKVFYEGNNSTSLLVAFEDVTDRRALEREKDKILGEKDELLRQKDLLLQEMNHRVNNSLQIIASILLLKAQTVQSEETRQHLQDAHERVMAVATVQEQLHPTPFGTQIEGEGLSDKALREPCGIHDSRRSARIYQSRCGRWIDDLGAGRQHGPYRYRTCHQCAEARLSRRSQGQNRRLLRVHCRRMASRGVG